jgi:Chalcone isomerase-like
VCSRRWFIVPALIALCAVLSGTPSLADPRAQFLPEAVVLGQALPLRGTGRLVWMRVVTVYDAALYLPAEVAGKDVLKDVPKRLELRYHISIKGEKFGESAVPYLEKNVPQEERARLKPRIDQLNRLYREVKEGDRYALAYSPGKGTTLSLNGEPLGTIEGADFAAAYFAIWLGKKPISDTLRDELTGAASGK